MEIGNCILFLIKFMPAFDRTGPLGQGPRTGRGMGPCGGGSAFGRGQGFGRGLGRGRGRGLGYGYSQPNADETKAYISDLEAELKDVKDYLKDLSTKK